MDYFQRCLGERKSRSLHVVTVVQQHLAEVVVDVA